MERRRAGFVSQRHRAARRRHARHRLNARLEAVAPARHRADEALLAVCQGRAQLADALHERVIRDDRMGPDSGDQLLLAQQAARPGEELAQQQLGLRTQRHRNALRVAHLAATKVEHEAIEPERPCLGRIGDADLCGRFVVADVHRGVRAPGAQHRCARVLAFCAVRLRPASVQINPARIQADRSLPVRRRRQRPTSDAWPKDLRSLDDPRYG